MVAANPEKVQKLQSLLAKVQSRSMTLEERLEASAASAVTAVPPVVAAAAAPAPVVAATPAVAAAPAVAVVTATPAVAVAPVREEPVSVKVPAEVKPLPEVAVAAAVSSVKTEVATAKAEDRVPTLESEGKLRAAGQEEDMPTVVQSSAEVEKALKSAKEGKKASALELAQAAAAEAPKLDVSAPIDAPIAKTTPSAPAKKAEEPASKTGFYLGVAIMLGLVVIAILKVFEIIKF